MREIKFRGKDKSTNEWVYGDLIHEHGQVFIRSHIRGRICIIPVKPETVGQFIGSYDINGIGIYEGDIIRYEYEDEKEGYIAIDKVEYVDLYSGFYPFYKSAVFRAEVSQAEILGNTYDNPELLEK